ncbi:enoyl-CoA hydratase/isomerase family protein [Variovorax sp. PBL-E5]|uniref:enoyl-CoA hydratase/isomerase family protein n=1 Tax=Variovorax sp. PBL-E5 TaxID=434014 RepID=UPI0013161E8D|nr:enoyl-CoA hydratase-related protein [Variovorax sp. PBL-E5]VTU46122.1 2,3-dehydroadipyl-CoA hydratase [Variovorax sp. PBL-E5]
MSEPVSKTALGRVTVLTMNAPEKMNAVSLEMRNALIESLHECFLDDACSAVVLAGAGGNFSAGGDIKSARPAPELLARTLRHKLGRLQELVRVICNAPKPVVAAVDGKAYGAGLSLATACDAVVAQQGAQFCAAFGKVGLVPDAGLFYTLPRRVGAARAQHMMLSARVVPAGEALDTGLVDSLAPEGELIAMACAEAERLAQIAPLAFAAIKSLSNSSCASLEQAFSEEQRLQPLLAMTEDNHEARSAFAERRKPVFRGR